MAGFITTLTRRSPSTFAWADPPKSQKPGSGGIQQRKIWHWVFGSCTEYVAPGEKAWLWLIDFEDVGLGTQYVLSETNFVLNGCRYHNISQSEKPTDYSIITKQHASHTLSTLRKPVSHKVGAVAHGLTIQILGGKLWQCRYDNVDTYLDPNHTVTSLELCQNIMAL